MKLARQGTTADRLVILDSLGKMGLRRAGDLVEALQADVRGEDISDRTRAAVWLARLAPDRAEQMIAFLTGVLAGWDVAARIEAALALGELGPLAKSAVPVLRRRAEWDEDRDVRRVAQEALKRVEKAAP
jgi:hypothetical protein